MNKKIISTVSSAIFGFALSGMALAAEININTADAQTLAQEINGVGPKIAERIIEWRQTNGPFESVEQLVEVRGIGEATLEKNRENLTIEGSSE